MTKYRRNSHFGEESLERHPLTGTSSADGTSNNPTTQPDPFATIIAEMSAARVKLTANDVNADLEGLRKLMVTPIICFKSLND